MVKFTDIFIKRPVLSTVISLLILIVGLAAYYKIPLRQYPELESTTITITTTDPGASAEDVKGFITTPLLQVISSADGVDYLTGSTQSGLSTITAYIKLDYDPNDAMTNITSAIDTVLNQLPDSAQTPTIIKQTGDTYPLMFINFSSNELTANQISAYIQNVITPQIYTISGISTLNIWGGQEYAMRIWLDTKRMAQLGVTPADVSAALKANNYQSNPGQLEGKYDLINLQASTDIHDTEQFDNLTIKQIGSRAIRLKDIGYAELGSVDYTSSANFKGKTGVFLTVNTTPGANPLTVIGQVRDMLPTLTKSFPPSLKSEIAYDATDYVRESIKEVIFTLLEATLIIVVIIFLFLGSVRAVFIPIVTIPLSIIGVIFLMLLMGFSINLLTLLAMVLAIGLVVDDAIVVLENIHRHLEDKMPALEAAKLGARQIAMPVIVMTLTLAAVFFPIGFMGGVTGALFTEFAFTLAAAVIISGIVALTFSPMLCSKIINEKAIEAPLAHFIDRTFMRLQTIYQGALHKTLENRNCILVMAITILISCYFLFSMTPSELAPQEDQGVLNILGNAPISANVDYEAKFSSQINDAMKKLPETNLYYTINGFPGTDKTFSVTVLKPWDERTRSQAELQAVLQKQVSKVAGLRASVVQRPVLPGTALGPPINFALKTTADYEVLYDAIQTLAKAARDSGLFLAVINNLRFDNPQFNLDIDRAKANDLGIDMQTIGEALGTMIGDNYINRFSKLGYSFKVIPQAADNFRFNQDSLNDINVATRSGQLVPLSSIVNISSVAQPTKLDQFGLLNTAILQAIMMPGVTMGDALTYLRQTAENILPTDITYDYGGASRQYIQEGQTVMYVFALSLIVIFLLLAAQFESFRDPFIIIVSVPMSIFGALVPLFLGLGTINIYTEVGFLTLIGLITKHGILMVEFANKLRIDEGLSARAAIEKASSIRLRPILMTTAAMVFGVLPLVFASGAGAVSRNDIGIVIACGMAIGTCFTLFVVPVMYSYISKKIPTQEHTYEATD